jgi:hypothetical protein
MALGSRVGVTGQGTEVVVMTVGDDEEPLTFLVMTPAQAEEHAREILRQADNVRAGRCVHGGGTETIN